MEFLGSKYFKEGYYSMRDEEIRRMLDNLSLTRNSLEITYLMGYEKALLLKDTENLKKMELINKIDSDRIIDTFNSIEDLVKYLKKNKEDIYIKQKILTELVGLNQYFYGILNGI